MDRPLWPRNGQEYLDAMQEAKEMFAMWELTHIDAGRSITVYSRKLQEDDDDAEDVE